MSNLARFHVAPYNRAPGTYVKYYAGVDSVTAPVVAATAPPGRPNFATLDDNTQVQAPPRGFAGALNTHVVQFKFTLEDDVEPVVLSITDLPGSMVLVDGKAYEQGSTVTGGQSVDVRFIADSTSYPLSVLKGPGGLPFHITEMHHDQGPEGANLHNLAPAIGPAAGGNTITITGVAINHDEAVVMVDDVELPAAAILEASDERLLVEMPPGPATGGTATVRVVQASGDGNYQLTSNGLEYTYLDSATKLAPIKYR